MYMCVVRHMCGGERTTCGVDILPCLCLMVSRTELRLIIRPVHRVLLPTESPRWSHS